MREFKGRVVAKGKVTATALVSHNGLNTLASFQKALQFGDKTATCGDQNNKDLYQKQMAGKALLLFTLSLFTLLFFALLFLVLLESI